MHPGGSQRFRRATAALALTLPAIIAATITTAATALASSLPVRMTCNPAEARFLLPDGQTRSIQIEIADTEASRAHGLMQRTALAPDSGMLFIYETPQPVAFWMRNTLIPLDMLFIDPTGRVARVHPDAIPHDETPIPGAATGDPAPERLMVLEIAGGSAARLGLGAGALLAHPRLPQDRAALPCD